MQYDGKVLGLMAEIKKEQVNLTINRKSKWRTFRDNFELSVMLIPGILFFLIFSYIPMFGVIIAFKDYRNNLGILGSKWVGLRNFKFFFTSQDAWRIARNTIGYGLVFIILGIVCSVTIAILLYEIKNKFALKFYQTTMILPHFLSWVIVGYITYILLEPNMGILNQILQFFGMKSIDWYLEPKYWVVILPLVNVWKTVGLSCIMYYAALMGIDEQLFEAATVDGASKWKQVKYITIPSLVPLMTVLTILHVGNIIKGDFGLFYNIPRNVGLLYPTTDIIDTYIYRGLQTGDDIGITTAVGLFQSFVGLVMVVATNKIVKKISPENSLF
ncbi:carbohydrate ABC transporter membrane protein 1, CUT1 family (TC 3.A.1.1.-) [Anaerocolumna jejuensis DSM 15929]|uniref:Carbohydrate ABC transporter membrane protein 1, CUT1 family (TC 3.A.1.1.-) n=1 Tax=Anaerocolumna jejuensis DSM 15929 TaxID=1121322 RepID=A0A1M6UE16_9FIRM|nr:ABC transporter permease subunit [Anaerocolumna jejuensis]SHK67411.1 carbohydrate ABC transporter membrane protein 1, CUT1 family (TC 3.A.1.1.-) [Anaerocolumna jejuensis DSM 15929]